MAAESSSSQQNDIINLRVRSHFFVDCYHVSVKPDCLIRELKKALIVSYYGLTNVPSNMFIMNKLMISHRLIAPIKSSSSEYQHRTLRDLLTVTEVDLNDGDELYFIRNLPPINSKSRQTAPKQLEIDELQDQILLKEIQKKMKNAGIPINENTRFITALDVQEYQAPEFFSDMRRILISFLEVLFITLCTLCNVNNPNIENILMDIKNHFLYTLFPSPLNPAYIIEFREMGFSPRRTKFAFFKTKYQSSVAAEWLKANKSVQSINIPESDDYQKQNDRLRRQFLNVPINDSSTMLTLFEQYREYVFKSDMFASSHLKELGYNIEEIDAALQKTTNSYPAAYRILANDTSPSLHNMQNFSYPNRLYQAMIEHLLRFYILDTKVIMAMLAFFREPEKIIFGWCWNREIAPVIFEIFETYNTEIQDLYHCDQKYGSVINYN